MVHMGVWQLVSQMAIITPKITRSNGKKFVVSPLQGWHDAPVKWNLALKNTKEVHSSCKFFAWLVNGCGRVFCCDCYIVCSVCFDRICVWSFNNVHMLIIYQEWYSIDNYIYDVELWKKQIYTITDYPGKSAALCCDNACVLHCELTVAGMWYVTGEQWLQQVNDSLSNHLILQC